MKHRRTSRRTGPGSDAQPRRIEGFSFIEILVSIVLLGTVVLATLVALRTTIVGSRLDRDHAKAQEWLQSASDAILRAPRYDCATFGASPAAARAHYAQYVDDIDSSPAVVGDFPVSPPEGWSGTPTISDVQFKVNNNGNEEWSSSVCADRYDGVTFLSPLYLQRIAIVATSPDGSILESVEVIKDDKIVAP